MFIAQNLKSPLVNFTLDMLNSSKIVENWRFVPAVFKEECLALGYFTQFDMYIDIQILYFK